MSLWIQHGYAKGDKLDRLLSEEGISGVVLSPADEGASTLAVTAAAARSAGAVVTLDPQTYVWGIADGVASRHAEHGLEAPTYHWSMAPSEVAELVERVSDINRRLATDLVIAPTCPQYSFGDPWTGLAIQFARASVGTFGTDRCVVSVVIDEAALSSWTEAEDWLDVATGLDAAGFYIVVARARDAYLRPWNAERLVNLLRLIYRLSVLNDYRVLMGYSDLDGLPMLAAGASEISSGWYQTLRSFSFSKWQPSSGGGRQRPRVTSPGLLTSLVADGEASTVARSRLGESVFPDQATRAVLTTDPEGWSLGDGWLQHLSVLGELTQRVTRVDGLVERLDATSRLLQEAADLLDQVDGSGTQLGGRPRARVQGMLDALEQFRTAESIS